MPNFIEECSSQLDKYWTEITEAKELTDTSLPQDIKEAIKQCINSKTKSYRYVLPTQILAKIVNPAYDSRSLQASSGCVGAFDARSLCHQVIVPFDKRNENVLGGSPEPYVNNPLRVGIVNASNRNAQKDKTGWDALCTVLDVIEQQNNLCFSELVFKQILVEIYNRLGQVKVRYPTPTRVSIESTLTLISTFIATPSGGEHPEAITYSIFKTISERYKLYEKVIRSKVNASDASAKQIADVECLDSDKIVIAIEIKDRTLTVEQMKSKIDDARSEKVSEILFIAEQGVSDQEKCKELIEREFSSGQNIYVYDIMKFIPPILILLGEEGRQIFLEEVCHTLDQYADIKSRRLWAKMLSDL